MTPSVAADAVATPIGRQGSSKEYPDNRPQPSERSFRSEAVDEFVADVSAQLADRAGPKVSAMFANCYPNTLDTTVQFDDTGDGPDTFVITGDIPAMWLRDSAAQVWPYLHLVADDATLARAIEGLIARQARCVLIDPYANGFLREPDSRNTHFSSDLTDMRPGVYERKWEVDSLAYFLRLSAGYREAGGELGIFDDTWVAAVQAVLDTYDVQRSRDAFEAYTFQRETPQASDSHPLRGRGNPGRPCGLIRSSFRCSDDASVFPYLIPSNLMAAAELLRTARLLGELDHADAAKLADRARTMASELRDAVAAHGTVEHPTHGRIYAYEVDGYGGVILMDDAGIPGFLSLPYLGAVADDDAIYANTRRFALSDDNPYYYEGTHASGVGSPHTDWGTVWPMSLLARGLSSGDDVERWEMVDLIASLDADTGFVHESLNPNDPAEFSRDWFSWVNGLFGELCCHALGVSVHRSTFEAVE